MVLANLQRALQENPGGVHHIRHTVEFINASVREGKALAARHRHTHMIMPTPVEEDRVRRDIDQNPNKHAPVLGKCANCKGTDHRVRQCQKTSPDGYVNACPCNSKAHSAYTCKVMATLPEEDRIMIFYIERIHLPPFKHTSSWLYKWCRDPRWKNVVTFVTECHRLASAKYNEAGADTCGTPLGILKCFH